MMGTRTRTGRRTERRRRREGGWRPGPTGTPNVSSLI